jgi:hypothetical protein
VIFVVQKVIGPENKTMYRLSIGKKDGVPSFLPPLPDPCIFEKSDYFREFLLCKCKLVLPQFTLVHQLETNPMEIKHIVDTVALFLIFISNNSL